MNTSNNVATSKNTRKKESRPRVIPTNKEDLPKTAYAPGDILTIAKNLKAEIKEATGRDLKIGKSLNIVTRLLSQEDDWNTLLGKKEQKSSLDDVYVFPKSNLLSQEGGEEHPSTLLNMGPLGFFSSKSTPHFIQQRIKDKSGEERAIELRKIEETIKDLQLEFYERLEVQSEKHLSELADEAKFLKLAEKLTLINSEEDKPIKNAHFFRKENLYRIKLSSGLTFIAECLANGVQSLTKRPSFVALLSNLEFELDQEFFGIEQAQVWELNKKCAQAFLSFSHGCWGASETKKEVLRNLERLAEEKTEKVYFLYSQDSELLRSEKKTFREMLAYVADKATFLDLFYRNNEHGFDLDNCFAICHSSFECDIPHPSQHAQEYGPKITQLNLGKYNPLEGHQFDDQRIAWAFTKETREALDPSNFINGQVIYS